MQMALTYRLTKDDKKLSAILKKKKSSILLHISKLLHTSDNIKYCLDLK
jgi:hypothetical protein